MSHLSARSCQNCGDFETRKAWRGPNALPRDEPVPVPRDLFHRGPRAQRRPVIAYGNEVPAFDESVAQLGLGGTGGSRKSVGLEGEQEERGPWRGERVDALDVPLPASSRQSVEAATVEEEVHSGLDSQLSETADVALD